MPARTLATLAADLTAAPDLDAAIRIVNDELESEKGTGVSVLAFDPRRNTIFDRRAVTPPGGTERSQVGIDHLPVTVRYAVLAGQRFADVGDQAAQYARLLGIPLEGDDVRLHLKGIVIDGSLSAVVALYERRRRVGGKAVERAAPLVDLLSVVYARFFERAARFEAVEALHTVTDRLRKEHVQTLGALEREIAQLRLAAGESGDLVRVAEQERSLERMRHRAEAAERRLSAVEEQVSSAVGRLERAHLQLHQQSEQLRMQSEQLRAFERDAAERALRDRLHPDAELRQERDDPGSNAPTHPARH